MDMQIAGAKAFVSGSTQGIGLAIARELLAEGASVLINGRSPERVEVVVAELRREFSEAVVDGLAVDFADGAAVRDAASRLEGVDILVNNVGLFGLMPFADITDESWSEYLEVNLMSGVRLSRHVLAGMLARGRGRIIFVSSESGVNVPSDMIHYGVTKAAVVALANGLAKLTKGTGVTVNTILGGPTYSEGVAGAVSQVAAARGLDSADVKAAIIGANQTSLIQRFIEPREIASLAVYLASPLSAATNGAAVRADGGVLTAML